MSPRDTGIGARFGRGVSLPVHEAAWRYDIDPSTAWVEVVPGVVEVSTAELQRVVVEAVAAERERCAEIAEAMAGLAVGYLGPCASVRRETRDQTARHIAERIRGVR